MKKLSHLLVACLGLLVCALPSVAAGPGATGGMGNRASFTGLDSSPIVLVDSGGKMEVGTLTHPASHMAVITTPTRTFHAWQGTNPPAEWSGAIFYDIRARETAVVVMHPITTFHDVLGRHNLSLDLGAFVGATTKTKAAVAGIYLGKTVPLADRVLASIALGITGQLGGTLGAGVTVGLQVKL